MKVIIIGAGRGSRLRPHTDDKPKCLVPVGGKAMLQWILDAFKACGLTDIIFVGGYRMDQIQEYAPKLTYIRNDNWENNNILRSLWYARDHMDAGFYCTYSDTIISQGLIRSLEHAEQPISLALDASWNERHGARPNPYQDHVEATQVEGQVVTRIDRVRPPGDAHGEFTGLTRFSSEGARAWKNAYLEAERNDSGGSFGFGKSFEKAYLVDLMNAMIQNRARLGFSAYERGYMEIDTVEDYELANSSWIHDLK